MTCRSGNHASADLFLGVPWNIASYGAADAPVAQVTGLQVRAFIHTFAAMPTFTRITSRPWKDN